MNTHTAAEAPSEIPVEQKKSAFDHAIEAQYEIRAEINELRQKIMAQLEKLSSIGGKDSYEEAVLSIVKAAGNKGVQVSKLHAVLPDVAALSKARLVLVENKQINSVKCGMSYKLTPVNA